MNDKSFLRFIHARLRDHHGENPNFDYMHKLLAIAEATPADRFTPNVPPATKRPAGVRKIVFKSNSPSVDMLRRRAMRRTYTTKSLVEMLNGKRPVPADEPQIKEYVDLLNQAD